MTRKDAVAPTALAALLVLSSLMMISVPRSLAIGPLVPQGIIYYVPITITNGQSSATSAPFQAMVQVNSQVYSYYEANDLRNVEFFASDGSIVTSWLESGASSSSTSTTYWLRVNGGLQASSSIVVYMGFASIGAVLMNGMVTGEAPQIPGTYGQYDNGGNVFNYYVAFGGLSGSALPFGWATDNVAYVTIRDRSTYGQFRFTSTSAAGTGAHVYAVSTPSSVTAYPTVLESFMSVSSYTTSGNYEVFGDLGVPGSSTMTAAVGYGKTCSGGVSGGNFYFMTGGAACLPTYQSPDNNNHVFSLLLASSSSLSTALIDYASVSGSAGIISQSYHNFGFGGGASVEGSGNLNVYWARTRAYPPGGVMPGVQFGSITPVPVESVNVSCATPPVMLGTSITCTAAVLGNSPTGTIAWTGTGSGTFVPSACTLSSGSCQTSYTPTNAATPITVTATYSGDAYNRPYSGSYSLSVVRANTTTTASCGSQPILIGTPTTCNAQVSGMSPSGFVSFTSDSGGTFQPASCTLAGGKCSVSYIPAAVGTVTVTASYDGDSNNQVSAGAAPVVVVRAPTSTSLTCVPSSVGLGSSTSCLATVTSGYSPGGIVTFVSTSGTGTFTPSNKCVLNGGTCQVSYYDTVQGNPQIIAAYGGDSNNGGSQGSAFLAVGPITSSSSSSMSSSTSSGGGGGAIPEFPVSAVALVVVVMVVLASYMVVRRNQNVTKS